MVARAAGEQEQSNNEVDLFTYARKSSPESAMTHALLSQQYALARQARSAEHRVHRRPPNPFLARMMCPSTSPRYATSGNREQLRCFTGLARSISP